MSVRCVVAAEADRSAAQCQRVSSAHVRGDRSQLSRAREVSPADEQGTTEGQTDHRQVRLCVHLFPFESFKLEHLMQSIQSKNERSNTV